MKNQILNHIRELQREHKKGSDAYNALRKVEVEIEPMLEQVKSVDLADVVFNLPSDSREFKEWQERNNIERLTGRNDYAWGGFIYKREFFLEKFMEAQNKAN